MLNGKIALVTGAGRGIGRKIAIELAKNGAYVIINYLDLPEEAEEVVAAMKENGGNGESYQCNVTNSEEVKAMMDFVIEKHNTIDILVNNAGITKDNLLLKMEEKDFDAVIAVNLKGGFLTSKYVIRKMIKQRSGRIINISSIVGMIGNSGQVNYSASKAGVLGMTKSLAREVASRGITVNAVAPGFIKSEMTAVLSEKVVEAMLENIPMKRLGDAQEIADAVIFLASEKASYITGQVIQVNGGMNM